ncbi:DEAD/DEAH box helicase [Treponema sp.]|uniref:DEAD/DEAH box helicase n=1 Tax=Treponema sp. TaxID=166 RepID=UPI003F044DF5
MSNFSQLNIDESIIRKLEENGITEPTEVQKKVIPLIAEGKNIFFQSETGTGKTFAYLLPLLTRLNSEETNSVSLMIASPTYELASQIKVQLQKVCGIKCALLIGGAPIARQIDLLKEKPRVVIGGPARLLELIHLKKLKADKIEILVLDEADRLLSPEMREDTKNLMERLPKSVQIIGNSATVSALTRDILQKERSGTDGAQENQILFVSLPMEDVLRKRISHWAIFAERRDKIDTLRSFINAEKPGKLLVFTSKSDQIENIASKLRFKKIECETLCGKTNKVDRKSAIDRFRSGKIKILITTDLASRGLDISGITHVVQMDLPEKEDFFIHRAGRTARAGATGINCVIGDAWEMNNYARLEKKLKITVFPKMLYKGSLVDPNSLM